MYCSADRLQCKIGLGKLRRLCAFSARCVENGRQRQLSKCYCSPEDHPPKADGGLAWVGQMLNRKACDFNYSPTAVSLSLSLQAEKSLCGVQVSSVKYNCARNFMIKYSDIVFIFKYADARAICPPNNNKTEQSLYRPFSH